MHWDQESVWNKQTNNHSIEMFLINDESMNNSQSESLLISTRSARMEETSINEIKSIKQYSKLISIELPGMDDPKNHPVDWQFEDLEYLNSINIQYSEILSNVTERGS